MNGNKYKHLSKFLEVEIMAKRHIPMIMEDWAKRIDIILEATGDAVMIHAGKITAEFTKSFLESKFADSRWIFRLTL